MRLQKVILLCLLLLLLSTVVHAKIIFSSTRWRTPHLPPFFFECVCSCVHRFPMLSCQFFCGEKVYISQTSPLGEQEQRLLRPHLADHTVDDTDHGVNFPRRV